MNNDNAGDLAKVITQESNTDWPTTLEIVAYFGENRRRRRSIRIEADEFFGRGKYGAPMPSERLVAMINKLRRMP